MAQRISTDRKSGMDVKNLNLPLSTWEMAVIEMSLRHYAENYGLISNVTKRWILNLADQVGEANTFNDLPANLLKLRERQNAE